MGPDMGAACCGCHSEHCIHLLPFMYLISVGIPADQTVRNSGAQPISGILHIENWIVCSIETCHPFNISTNVVSPNETGILKGFLSEMCALT